MKILSFSSIQIAKNTITNKNPVILLIILILDKIKLSAKTLIIIPIITGIVTTKAIFKAIPITEISFVIVIPKIFAEVITITGILIIQTKLVTAVKEIDKATSPLANFVKTFEVTPPGAEAMIIKPIAIAGGRFRLWAIIKATSGNKINWEKKPTIKSLGVLNILLKSLAERPKPNPSIISANTIGAILVTISIIFQLILHFIKSI